MKVIHIAGFSNTGKTTLITRLLPELEQLGPVGVVKHIGHHGYSLPEGKDTTRFFGAGAIASAGIDEEKSVLIIKEHDLGQVLETFSDAGIEYAIVEGWKERPFPKIVIGEVPDAEHIVMKDPSVKDVLAHLDDFAELVTSGSFTRELQHSCPPGMTTLISAIPVTTPISREKIGVLKAALDDTMKEFGDVFVRLRTSGSIETGSPYRLMIGVCAPDPKLAIEGLLVATDHLLPSFSNGAIR